jgi:hypothetical protein
LRHLRALTGRCVAAIEQAVGLAALPLHCVADEVFLRQQFHRQLVRLICRGIGMEIVHACLQIDNVVTVECGTHLRFLLAFGGVVAENRIGPKGSGRTVPKW